MPQLTGGGFDLARRPPPHKRFTCGVPRPPDLPVYVRRKRFGNESRLPLALRFRINTRRYRSGAGTADRAVSQLAGREQRVPVRPRHVTLGRAFDDVAVERHDLRERQGRSADRGLPVAGNAIRPRARHVARHRERGEGTGSTEGEPVVRDGRERVAPDDERALDAAHDPDAASRIGEEVAFDGHASRLPARMVVVPAEDAHCVAVDRPAHHVAAKRHVFDDDPRRVAVLISGGQQNRGAVLPIPPVAVEHVAFPPARPRTALNSRLFLTDPVRARQASGLRKRVADDFDLARHAIPDANRPPAEHHVLAGSFEVVVAQNVWARPVQHQHRLRIASPKPEAGDVTSDERHLARVQREPADTARLSRQHRHPIERHVVGLLQGARWPWVTRPPPSRDPVRH